MLQLLDRLDRFQAVDAPCKIVAHFGSPAGAGLRSQGDIVSLSLACRRRK
jgi:hypothetical protein